MYMQNIQTAIRHHHPTLPSPLPFFPGCWVTCPSPQHKACPRICEWPVSPFVSPATCLVSFSHLSHHAGAAPATATQPSSSSGFNLSVSGTKRVPPARGSLHSTSHVLSSQIPSPANARLRGNLERNSRILMRTSGPQDASGGPRVRPIYTQVKWPGEPLTYS
ncbi:hypothetical protein VTG60DRAFT_2286 [Thermothelomyces hinnuleus]